MSIGSYLRIILMPARISGALYLLGFLVVRKVAWANDDNSFKLLEDKQILITGNDALAIARCCRRQNIVVIGIAANWRR
jgi:hypothetical protein